MVRTLLLTVVFSLGTILSLRAEEKHDSATSVQVDAKAVVGYVLSCRKAKGAFGPLDQEYTDAAWNYPAVHALLLLGEQIPEPEKILTHGLGFPTGHAGGSHWLLFHQAMLQKLLAARVKVPAGPVRLVHQGTKLHYYGHPLGQGSELLYHLDAQDFLAQTQQAGELGYYNLASLYYTLSALAARGQQPANGPELVDYILRRQASSGGFADVRGAQAVPSDADAHIATTWQAVQSLKLLSAEVPDTQHCAAFVQQCQSRSGAFRPRLAEAGYGLEEDIYYTWAALQTLAALGQTVPLAAACGAWINSLQNADGGFGDKPGWRSRLYSTYYAVHALALLGAAGKPSIVAKVRTVEVPRPIPDGEFHIYQGLNKMPVCTPADLPGLLRRKLNLIAVKSDEFPLAESLRAACQQQRLPLDAVLCVEAYPHRALRGADVLLDHVANFTLNPSWSEEQRAIWRRLDERGRLGLPWAEYQAQVLRPAQELGSLVYPEQDFEMELAYEAYDAGVAGSSGYRAMLAGFNWIPRDFVRVFPWRERYVDKLTMVADCDAHGDLAKWSPQLDSTRHLYIATGPSYAEYLEAAAAGRVVCAIVGAEGVASGVTYYGPAPAVEYVRERIGQWRWW
jgi:prenyltransferase beta subunit